MALQSAFVLCKHSNFLTNTTSRPRRALVDQLASMGIEVEEAAILTPAVAAVHRLERETTGPVTLFVPPATAEEFAHLPRLPDSEESGAAAIVIGDLGPAWDFGTLNRAFRLLMENPAPELVALGMTRYWRAADGLRLDVGPFVKALEYASGAEAVVLGKPAGPFFRTALELLDLPVGKVGTQDTSFAAKTSASAAPPAPSTSCCAATRPSPTSTTRSGATRRSESPIGSSAADSSWSEATRFCPRIEKS